LIAALFVDPAGIYSGRPDVDCWGVERDARLYDGPHPVVAHPPCERWGRHWSGGPSAKVRRELGDDAGCFAAALGHVLRFGGVLEHPEASHAFRVFGLGRPKPGSWQESGFGWVMRPGQRGWVTQVAQSAYGHRARKRTWLFCAGYTEPAPMDWSEPQGERLDEGFHSKEERDAARAAGVRPRARLSTRENLATPPAFAEALIRLALDAKLSPCNE